MKPPSVKPNNPFNTKLGFVIMSTAIAAIIFACLTEPHLPSRMALSILSSLFLTPIIYGVLIVDDKPKQITSNTLAAVAVFTFFMIFAMPDTSLAAALGMLVVSVTLLVIAEKTDTTNGRT